MCNMNELEITPIGDINKGIDGSDKSRPLNERDCIPPHTVCPYKEKCDPNGNFCNHRGLNHAAEYSCALARVYQLFNH